jgi:hypothetical protein
MQASYALGAMEHVTNRCYWAPDPSSITYLVVQSPDTSAQGSQKRLLGQELEGR